MAAEMIRINTRVSTEINEWLDEQSDTTGVPKSTLIHIALNSYIQQHKAISSMDQLMQKMSKFDKVLQRLDDIEKKLD